MKKILISALLVMPIAFGHTEFAQAEAFDRELFNLCSRFPLNSRCEGFEVPIPLNLRSGDEAICQITSAGVELSGRCKVSLANTTMTAYVETGESLDILEGERHSQEISIPINTITNFTYREDTRANTGRLIGNILVFGIIGALTTRPDNIAQLEIRYTPASETSLDNSDVLLLEADRDLGSKVKTELERLTGIQAEIPSEEESKPESPSEANPETHQ
jgi:hypothetical protein